MPLFNPQSATLINGVALPATPKTMTPANPTGTTSATQVMMGLGAAGGGQACVYTPAGTGHVLVVVSGVAGTTAGTISNLTLSAQFGTGTPPANAAAVSGTLFGGSATETLQAKTQGTNFVSFVFPAVLTLTPGTQYWVDLALSCPGGTNTQAVQSVAVTFIELPT